MSSDKHKTPTIVPPIVKDSKTKETNDETPKKIKKETLAIEVLQVNSFQEVDQLHVYA